MTREEILSIAKPILFNTDMTRAILEERKTAMRRLIKPPYFVDGDENDPRTLQVLRTAPKGSWLCKQIGSMPYPDNPYKVGDYLYVRETWKPVEAQIFHCQTPPPRVPEMAYGYEYKADNGYFWNNGFSIDDVYRVEINSYKQWRPSIHMPKEAARIFLRVTDVQVERLQDMTLDDFLSEGVVLRPEAFNDSENAYQQAQKIFIGIWNPTTDDLIYKWDANPWVWVIEFERVIPD